jgi:multiple sugar transport system substrate-binding protein
MIQPTFGKRDSTRRRLPVSKLVLTAVATATLAGFGPGLGSSAIAQAGVRHAQAVVNITWWTMWSGSSLIPVNQFVSQFNKTHSTIHVTEANVSGSTGDAKLLSAIAAGDPPDVFTEWNATLGQYANAGAILPLDQYLTGSLAGLKKWEYPSALLGGMYNGKLYAIPQAMNSWALYYNKSMLKSIGVSSPPATLAEFQADQAKEWKITDGHLVQYGFYPYSTGGTFMSYFLPFFGAANCFSGTKYDLEHCPGAQAAAAWTASYSKYPYALVTGLQAAEGTVSGGGADPFSLGKAGFEMSGPWIGSQFIYKGNPSMDNNFGVIPFPATGLIPPGGTLGQGNYDIVPKGSKHPAQAVQFMAWLAGYQNTDYVASIETQWGWIPASPSVTSAAPFQAYVHKNPWMNTFLQVIASKYAQTPRLTPHQAAYYTATQVATQELLTKKWTTAQALRYIDQQGNA